jgi:hypothetical protein
MAARTTGFAALAAGCIVAAGFGGFYAVRAGQEPDPAGPPPVVQASAAADSGDSSRASEPTEAQNSPAATTPALERALQAAPLERPIPAGDSSPAPAVPREQPRERRVSAPPAKVTESPARIATPPASAVAPVPPPVSATSVATTPLPDVPAAPPVDLPAPPPPVEIPRPRTIQLTVAEGSVMGIRLETALSTETARVEDPVTAVVTRDVTVDGVTAIPAGARLEGHVTLVDRGGRFRQRARLGIRFTTLVLAEHTRVRIDTDTITRDGESPTGEATSKIGASAVVGSILGAVIGGKKGAAIGGAAGAAGGTAAVAASGPNAAQIASGAMLTLRFSRDLTLQVERQGS